MKVTRDQGRWMAQLRQACRQVAIKRQQKGRVTRKLPFTWQDFRDWFKDHFQAGVQLGIPADTQFMKRCQAGMAVPDWKFINWILGK